MIIVSVTAAREDFRDVEALLRPAPNARARFRQGRRGLSKILCMAIDKDLLDRLLAGRDARELFGSVGLLDELKKALSERILLAELDDHLVQEEAIELGNRRNGTSKKTVLSGTSQVTLDISP